MEKNLIQRRQGDILIMEIADIPEDAQKQTTNIVARGEVTGHTHRLSAGAQAAIMMAGASMYIECLKQSKLLHDEHAPIDLPVGNYKVVRQQEFLPRGWQQVAD